MKKNIISTSFIAYNDETKCIQRIIQIISFETVLLVENLKLITRKTTDEGNKTKNEIEICKKSMFKVVFCIILIFLFIQ